MTAQFTEHEIKLLVPGLEAVERALQAAGAPLTAPRVLEVNVRYDTANHSLTRANQVLRLRRDSRTRLTYKDESTSTSAISSGRTRFEAEVDVSNFDAMAMILSRLGYVPYMIYEKYRTTYTLEGAEVVLDELPFGTFVEIEGDSATIDAVIQRLDLAAMPVIVPGYVGLFEAIKTQMGLKMTDLTFGAFKGITVDPKLIARVGA